MTDEIDFYEEGLIAAKLAEEGKVDGAKELIGKALADLVTQGYRSQADEIKEGYAKDILACMESEDEENPVKRASLELMLIDKPASEQKNEIINRYMERSVKRLGLAQKKPGLASAAELFDDISKIVLASPWSATKLVLRGGRYLLEKSVKGMQEYWNASLDEKVQGIGKAGKFSLYALSVLAKTVVRIGIYSTTGPTGMRKGFGYIRERMESNKNDFLTQVVFLPALLGSVTTFILAASYGICLIAGVEFSQTEELLFGTAFASWAISTPYEVGRVVRKLYVNKRDEFKALHSPSEEVAPRVRLEVDIEPEIPVYFDNGGREERVYADEPAVMKKMVVSD